MNLDVTVYIKYKDRRAPPRARAPPSPPLSSAPPRDVARLGLEDL